MKKSELAEAVSHLQECLALLKPSESLFVARVYCAVFQLLDDLCEYFYSKYGEDVPEKLSSDGR